MICYHLSVTGAYGRQETRKLFQEIRPLHRLHAQQSLLEHVRRLSINNFVVIVGKEGKFIIVWLLKVGCFPLR